MARGGTADALCLDECKKRGRVKTRDDDDDDDDDDHLHLHPPYPLSPNTSRLASRT